MKPRGEGKKKKKNCLHFLSMLVQSTVNRGTTDRTDMFRLQRRS